MLSDLRHLFYSNENNDHGCMDTNALALLMDALKIQLNVGQNMAVNTSFTFMSLEIPTESFHPWSCRISFL